eukprot:gene10969-12131_t
MAAEAIKAFDSRLFEKILKSKFKNADIRRKVYRRLLTELVEKERIETTLPRAQDVSRIANRMIDLAKEKKEPIMYTWLTNKALIPKVFDLLVPRYQSVSEVYTRVYRIPPRYHDKAPLGVVEFIGNDLPALEPNEDELVELKKDFLLKKLQEMRQKDGVLV